MRFSFIQQTFVDYRLCTLLSAQNSAVNKMDVVTVPIKVRVCGGRQALTDHFLSDQYYKEEIQGAKALFNRETCLGVYDEADGGGEKGHRRHPCFP